MVCSSLTIPVGLEDSICAISVIGAQLFPQRQLYSWLQPLGVEGVPGTPLMSLVWLSSVWTREKQILEPQNEMLKGL